MSESPDTPLTLPSPYAAFDAVGVAASMGGLSAVAAVLGALPADFPAAVVVVLHRATGWGDGTASFLARRTALHVKAAEDGEPLRPGVVYVAPPDRKVCVERPSRLASGQVRLAPGQVRLAPGQARLALGQAQRCRADDVFGSLATVFGERAIGVVLTGRLDDGAAGIKAIKARGGRGLAQDRATSEHFGMPSAAMSTGCIDWVLPLHRIAPTLISLVMWPGAAELLRVPPPPWATLGA